MHKKTNIVPTLMLILSLLGLSACSEQEQAAKERGKIPGNIVNSAKQKVNEAVSNAQQGTETSINGAKQQLDAAVSATQQNLESTDYNR